MADFAEGDTANVLDEMALVLVVQFDLCLLGLCLDQLDLEHEALEANLVDATRQYVQHHVLCLESVRTRLVVVELLQLHIILVSAQLDAEQEHRPCRIPDVNLALFD